MMITGMAANDESAADTLAVLVRAPLFFLRQPTPGSPRYAQVRMREQTDEPGLRRWRWVRYPLRECRARHYGDLSFTSMPKWRGAST